MRRPRAWQSLVVQDSCLAGAKSFVDICCQKKHSAIFSSLWREATVEQEHNSANRMQALCAHLESVVLAFVESCAGQEGG